MIQKNHMTHKILDNKDPTICTNCRNLSIQSPELGNPMFYMTSSHQLMGTVAY